MRRFVLGGEKLGLRQRLGRIVTCADDLMILCRGGKAEEALHWMHKLMGTLKLTVSAEKTRICKVPEGEFNFLGFTFGRTYSPRTGQARLPQSVKRIGRDLSYQSYSKGRCWLATAGGKVQR
jgi:RNA-directed DNA polymerase